jgi:mono/diheme cytochrome c family protein
MKKALKIIGWAAGVVALTIGGLVAYVALTGVPRFAPPVTPDIVIKATPARLQRGAALAQLQCMPCHANRDNRLTGKHMADVPALFGKVYSQNITQDPEKGIGKWTDGQLLHLLRTGIRPDGSMVGIMISYPLMADEDLHSLVAWLRSDAYPVQATQEEAPQAEFSLAYKLLLHTVLRPVDVPQRVITVPDTNDEIAFGRYAANVVGDCYTCHSASVLTIDKLQPERSEGFYGGGFEMLDDQGKPIRTANITFDEETGIGGKYTKEQFIRALKVGVRPDGSLLRYPMEPRPGLTDREAGAIYAYLKTLPKLHNAIPREPGGK